MIIYSRKVRYLNENIEERVMIIKCETCNAWLASNSNRVWEEHKSECGITNDTQETRTVIRFKMFDHNYKKIAKCIIELNNVRFRAIVFHLRGERFRIINTSSPDYRDLIGKVIDASDICEVLQ